MRFISSDTNVWIDFSIIGKSKLPFLLPYTFIMSKESVEDELLVPAGLGEELVSYGLLPVEMTIEEFFLAESYGIQYRRLSRYDRIALAIAKERNITLLTGDNHLRKAAVNEGVDIMGTIGIFDHLLDQNLISTDEFKECLQSLLEHNGGAVRLPENEILSRLKKINKNEI